MIVAPSMTFPAFARLWRDRTGRAVSLPRRDVAAYAALGVDVAAMQGEGLLIVTPDLVYGGPPPDAPEILIPTPEAEPTTPARAPSELRLHRTRGG